MIKRHAPIDRLQNHVRLGRGWIASIALCILFCLPLSTAAQFVVAIGGEGGDESRRVVADGSGGAFVTGVFADTVDFDPGAGVSERVPHGGTDVFLARYDASGDLNFAVTFGNGKTIGVQGMALDAAGGVFITGNFRDTLDIDPGVGVTNIISGVYLSIFFARFDGAGNLVFAHKLAGNVLGASDAGNDLMADGKGGVWMAGRFTGTVDFDPGVGISNLTSAGALGASDAFLAHYDDLGGYVSAFRLGADGADDAISLALDDSGGFYLGGAFAGTVDFDPGAGTSTRTSAGTRDIFVARYDSLGAFQSVYSIGSVNGESLGAIAADDSGGTFVTGRFWGSIDFDPTAGTSFMVSQGSDDIFIAHYDRTGALIFGHGFGTSSAQEGGNDVISDLAGGAYVLGTFQNTVDFDPDTSMSILATNGGVDAVLAHYTSAGAYISSIQFGGQYGEVANALDYRGPEEIFLTGSFQSAVDFDPGPGTDNRTSNGVLDVFLVRLNNVPTPAATSTKDVSSNGTTDFGNGTAVCIDWDGVFFQGTITVERFDVPVESPEGVGDPVVYTTHWRIIASLGFVFTATTVVRIKLDDLPGGSIPGPANVQFYKRSLYGAGVLEPITTTYNSTTNEIEITGFSTFSEFVAAGNTSLPIELSSLRATSDGSDVILVWTTESETDNVGFDVEHRVDGVWQRLAFVEGAGTTDRPLEYQYRVSDLRPGIHAFRLRQIDYDGSFEYSHDVEATIGVAGTHELSPVFPNPMRDRGAFSLSLAREQRIRIELFDVIGRRTQVLHDGTLTAGSTHRFTIESTDMPPGVYMLRVQGDLVFETRKLLKIR